MASTNIAFTTVPGTVTSMWQQPDTVHLLAFWGQAPQLWLSLPLFLLLGLLPMGSEIISYVEIIRYVGWAQNRGDKKWWWHNKTWIAVRKWCFVLKFYTYLRTKFTILCFIFHVHNWKNTHKKCFMFSYFFGYLFMKHFKIKINIS